MNAKTIIFVILFTSLLLSACAPATQAPTSAPIAVQPKANTPAGAGRPTTAPAATKAPAAISSGAGSPTRAAAAPPAGQPWAMPAATAAPAAPYAPQPSYPSNPYAPYPAPQDNYFQDYGINGFVDARKDHLSTFAVDVDTASYTLARRYIQDGSLPPADAVRVEEFVNYFDPGYRPPENSAFAIYADGAPSPFQAGITLLRIGLQGYQVPDRLRKPTALTFLVDVSGSMAQQNRLEMVKDSLRLLVERLRKTDIVSIAAFDTNAWVVLIPTAVSQRDSILRAIDSLRPGNSTNVDAGLKVAYQLATKALQPDGNNRIILCSDGVANTGNVNPDSILAYVSDWKKDRISLSTFGFGMGNFNDALLEHLADRGNGSYAYVDSMDEARRLFVENLSATLQTIARDAKIQVDFNPDSVAAYRLMGYENRAVADQDFRNNAVDAGEIGAGHHVVAIYAIQTRPEANGRIATIQVRWADPQTAKVSEINGNVNTWDLAARYEQATPYYQLNVLAAQFAEVLRSSPYARRTSLYQLAEMAGQLPNALPENQAVIEFADLVRRAASRD